MISMNEEQFELDNTPDAENLWKAIGGSFSNISQAINEFVDDSISNFRRNCGNAAMIRTVRLTLNACGEMVNITVEDGGTGIRNLSNAMTLAGQADRETPLNEHGYGLKHALAYVDAKGSGWEIATRTEEDLKRNRCQVIKSPYAIGKGKLNSVYLGPTGTMISVSCSMELLRTLCPEDNEKQKTFWQMVDILEEDLRYTYADILYKGEADIELVVSDGKASRQKKLKPLFPQWEAGTLQELPVPERFPGADRSADGFLGCSAFHQECQERLPGGGSPSAEAVQMDPRQCPAPPFLPGNEGAEAAGPAGGENACQSRHDPGGAGRRCLPHHRPE